MEQVCKHPLSQTQNTFVVRHPLTWWILLDWWCQVSPIPPMEMSVRLWGSQNALQKYVEIINVGSTFFPFLPGRHCCITNRPGPPAITRDLKQQWHHRVLFALLQPARVISDFLSLHNTTLSLAHHSPQVIFKCHSSPTDVSSVALCWYVRQEFLIGLPFLPIESEIQL